MILLSGSYRNRIDCSSEFNSARIFLETLKLYLVCIFELDNRADDRFVIGLLSTADGLELINPVFELFAFLMRVIMTPIAILGAIFEWVGNVIYNLGKFINNVGYLLGIIRIIV